MTIFTVTTAVGRAMECKAGRHRNLLHTVSDVGNDAAANRAADLLPQSRSPLVASSA